MRCVPLHPEFKRVRSSTELPPTSLCTDVEEKWKIFNAKDGGRGDAPPACARALRLEFENISRKFVTCTIFACASFFFLTFFCQTKTGSTRASINITKDGLNG